MLHTPMILKNIAMPYQWHFIIYVIELSILLICFEPPWNIIFRIHVDIGK